MSITSDELNYLIHRYLQESGFTHSAFAFGNEACVSQSNITPSLVPPGALISMVHKGLQFVEAEMSITADGKLLDEGLVEPLSLIDAVRPNLSSRTLRAQVEEARREIKEEPIDDVTQKVNSMDTDEKGDYQERPHKPRVSLLKGHDSEVFICAWNPQRANLLASGSGDSTARIWNVDETSQSQSMVLRHPQTEYMVEGSRGVTTLDWNWDGSQLATGAYDGIARVWSTDNSSLHRTLSKHQAPIFVLKWSPDGDTLVTGGVDKYVVVWDPDRGDARFQLDLHTAATLDIDWRSADVFASCSSDRQIKVCQIDSDSFTVLKTFHGHMNEVNAIKWDPSGTVLASCSDDRTTKLWSLRQDEPLHELKEHKKGIYTLRWSPDQSTGPQLLATGSYDSTVRLWDVNVGKSVHTFTQHREAVYSVMFSPDGRFIASGSFDKWLHIWSVKDRTLVYSYQGNAGIFEVCWNSTGSKLAATYADSMISILDLKYLVK